MTFKSVNSPTTVGFSQFAAAPRNSQVPGKYKGRVVDMSKSTCRHVDMTRIGVDALTRRSKTRAGSQFEFDIGLFVWVRVSRTSSSGVAFAVLDRIRPKDQYRTRIDYSRARFDPDSVLRVDGGQICCTMGGAGRLLTVFPFQGSWCLR